LLDQILGKTSAQAGKADAPDTLNDSWLRQAQTETWIAGVDFGTTFSKAAVVRRSLDQIQPDDLRILELGDDGALLLPSAIYIDGDRLFFGRKAFDRSLERNDPNRDRFESPKHYLSAVNSPELDGAASVRIDPEGRFKNGELLQLLLAFLSASIMRALKRQPEFKDQVPKFRISRPAWERTAELQGEKLLSSYLGRAFLLGATLGDQLLDPDGLKIDAARNVLDAVNKCGFEPGALFNKLLVEPGASYVPESTAVAAAHVRPEAGQGRVIVVADIGGGTSDFGAFLSVPGRDKRGRIQEIGSVRRSVPLGGDELDARLITYLKRKNDLEDQAPAHAAKLARLRRDVRTLKLELFAEGALVGELKGDREEFLNLESVQVFAGALREAFNAPADEARGYRQRSQHVARTGGGATLPFILDLGADLRPVELPPWIDNPNLQMLYPQLAVAIGAAMPSLPEQK